jgi:hypothetical protein
VAIVHALQKPGYQRKNKPQIVTAIGRELPGFIWAIAVGTEAKFAADSKAA